MPPEMESSEILNINIAPRKECITVELPGASNRALLSPISANATDNGHLQSLEVERHAQTEAKDDMIIDIGLPESGAQD